MKRGDLPSGVTGREADAEGDVFEKPYDLSDGYWGGLSAADKALYRLVRPQPKAVYTVNQRLPGMSYCCGEVTSASSGVRPSMAVAMRLANGVDRCR